MFWAVYVFVFFWQLHFCFWYLSVKIRTRTNKEITCGCDACMSGYVFMYGSMFCFLSVLSVFNACVVYKFES